MNPLPHLPALPPLARSVVKRYQAKKIRPPKLKGLRLPHPESSRNQYLETKGTRIEQLAEQRRSRGLRLPDNPSLPVPRDFPQVPEGI